MIRVVCKSRPIEQQLDFKDSCEIIDCTSHNPDKMYAEGLSPFYLGRDCGVDCYNDLKAWNMENAWQYAKVYKCHVGSDNEPTQEYFRWRDRGWGKKSADRYPMGRGAKPEYSLWMVDGKLEHLDYIDARKQIYIPLYARLVVKTNAYASLKALRDSGKNLVLVDFDGYNNFKTRPKMSWSDVMHCERRKMGHAFVLAMLLEGLIAVSDSGTVSLSSELDLIQPAESSFDISSLQERA